MFDWKGCDEMKDICIMAEFENGYFLIVEVDEIDNEYLFTVCDSEGYYQAFGYTEYRSIDMYYPMNEIDYILQYCDPVFVKGSYKIIEAESLEKYLENRKG